MADGVSGSTRRLLDHMRQGLAAARASRLRIMFVPHRRTSPGDYDTWAHLSPSQETTRKGQVFTADTWGGEFHPDFQPREGEVRVSTPSSPLRSSSQRCPMRPPAPESETGLHRHDGCLAAKRT